MPEPTRADRRKLAADRLRRAIERQAIQQAAAHNAELIAAQARTNAVNAPAEPPKPAGGRPREHDRMAVFDSIMTALAQGKTIHEACRKAGVSASTVRKWAYTDDHCRAKWAEAKQIQADAMADRAIREALKASGQDAAGVAAQRLRVDTLKWYVSHLDPARYGQRPDRDAAGERVVRVIFEDDVPTVSLVSDTNAPVRGLPPSSVEDAEYTVEG